MPCMNFSEDRESSERMTAFLDEVDLEVEARRSSPSP